MYTPNPRYSKLYAEKQPYFGPDVETKNIPVPIGGWDSISPLANMDPKYAVTLINWVPRTGYVEFRGGYNAWSQALSTSPVNSLMVYRPPSGIEVLFAATEDSIYDCSLYGIYTLSLSGLLSSRIQYVNFTPASSNTYLLCVNGVNPYFAYNGSVWSEPTITGVDADSLININIFKRRVWFIEDQSTKAWYLDTDAIQGTAHLFDLGAFLSKGSYLVAMGTWTVDGGNGPDDLAVFISNKGQAVIYKGTDPGNANAWSLVGVFDFPPPISRRCFTKVGAELAIITTQGLIPVSQGLPFDPAATRSVAFTNRIQNSMLQIAQFSREFFGWQCLTFPQQALLILNIPVQENTLQVQYVMNTITGAWTQFQGWNANCFEIFNESLYFGDNIGNVNLAYAGTLDLVSPILADMKCAFNYFDDPGRNKNMTMLRPMIVADGTLIPSLSVDVDFADSSPEAPVVLLQPTGAIWDVSLWDVALLSSGTNTVVNWLSVLSLGTALAVRMKVNLGGVGVGGSSVAADSVFDTGVFDTMVFDGNGATIASGTNLITLQVNAFEALMQFGSPI